MKNKAAQQQRWERISMKNNKKLILAIVALVLVVGLMAFAWLNFGEKAVAGEKDITIEVINSKGESTVYELNTNAEYLEGAMEEAKAQGFDYVAIEGPYGLEVQSICGESGVYELDGAYWGFNVNGDYCNYGISQQPVNDGDAFQIVWTKA